MERQINIFENISSVIIESACCEFRCFMILIYSKNFLRTYFISSVSVLCGGVF